MIDSAIRHNVYLQAATSHSGLTAIDLFYKEVGCFQCISVSCHLFVTCFQVSSVEGIVRYLVKEEESLLTPDLSHEESLEIVELVNRTLEVCHTLIFSHQSSTS